MYLYERIIGVCTYTFITLIMTFLIYKSDIKKLKKFLTIYLMLLFILAYIYIPATSADLHRYIITAHDFSSYSLSGLLKLMISSSSPIHVLYFYALGKIGIDGLIPAITSLIYYGLYFYVLYKCSKKYNLSNKSVAFSLILIMSMGGFLTVINAIRAFIAYSIIYFCVFREIIEGKSIMSNIIMYLIAALFHLSAIVIIILRFFIALFEKEKTTMLNFLKLLSIVLIAIIGLKYGNNYLASMIEKADYYTSNEVYSYLWEYIISYMYMFFSTYVLLILCKKKFDNYEMNKLLKFNLIINIFIFVFAFEYSIFSRFQMFSGLIFTPIFAYYITSLENQNKKKKTFTLIYYTVVVLMLVIACTRGNLCGYKFLVFK